MPEETNLFLRLRSLFLEHRWTIVRYALVTIAVAVTGLAMLYLAVSQVGINKLFANLCLAPIMGVVGYLANRFIVFLERPTLVVESVPRWAGLKLAGFAASQLAFCVMVVPFGVQYVDARLYIMLVLGPVMFVATFVLGSTWIFQRKRTDKA